MTDIGVLFVATDGTRAKNGGSAWESNPPSQRFTKAPTVLKTAADTSRAGTSCLSEQPPGEQLVVPEQDWQVHYVFFARAGFTDAARAYAEALHARLVDLQQLEADLADEKAQRIDL